MIWGTGGKKIYWKRMPWAEGEELHNKKEIFKQALTNLLYAKNIYLYCAFCPLLWMPQFQ